MCFCFLVIVVVVAIVAVNIVIVIVGVMCYRSNALGNIKLHDHDCRLLVFLS